LPHYLADRTLVFGREDLIMLTAFVTVPPQTALPPIESVLPISGTHVVLGIVLAAIAIVAGALVQHALARPTCERATLHVVNERSPHGAMRAA
jgi:hypothetical protein